MACFKLKVGDNIYTLTDSGPLGSESDIVTKNDYTIIENYLINGTIGRDYVVEDAQGNTVDPKEFFNTLNESVVTSENFSTAVPNSLTAEVFINHLIGQGSTDESKYANNIWSNKLWGTNSWYGFTSKRGIVVAGMNNYTHQRLLFRLYENIKDGDKFSIELVNKLGKVDTQDIFKKLTWVANNKRSEVLAILLEMESKSDAILRGRTLRQELRLHANKYVGHNVSIGNDFYIITGNSRADLKGDTITLLNVGTGKVEVKEIKSINRMHDTKTVTIKDETHCLIGGHWYLLKNSKFTPVTNSEELVQHFLGLSSKIVTDLRGVNVNAHQLLNKLSDSDSVTVYANGYYWTKQEGGFFNSIGEKLDEFKQIYSVISDVEIEGVKSLLPNCDKQLLSSSDIRILGVEHGVTDFTNISFSDIKSPVQFSKNADGVYKLRISYLDNVLRGETFENSLFNAFAFFKWINNPENTEFIAGLFNVDILTETVLNQFPEQAELKQEQISSHFKNGVNINKLFTFWNEGNIQLPVQRYDGSAVSDAREMLENNKKSLISKKATELYKELLDNGFFIYSCEL